MIQPQNEGTGKETVSENNKDECKDQAIDEEEVADAEAKEETE